MKHCDLDTSTGHLHDALEDLQIAWQQTTEQWGDAVSRRFCETHLEPIGPALKRSLDAVGQMQQLVDQIWRECES